MIGLLSRRGVAFWGVSLVLLALGAGGLCWMTPARAEDGHVSPLRQASVIILPFADYTRLPGTRELLYPWIEAEIAARAGFFVSEDTARSVLRAHRIRASAGLSAEEAAIIHEETGVTTALLGSFDVRRDGPDPELALSVRILDLPTARILAAASYGATGSQFAGLFGRGRIDSLADLTPRVVRRLFQELDQPADAWPVAGHAPRIALAPFDNLSDHLHAGEIVSGVLLSRLVREGFVVIEPGIIGDIFRESGLVPWGEVGYGLLDRIDEQEAVGGVITGVVQRFEPSSGPASPPRVEFGARLLDPKDHRIVLAHDRSRSGNDGWIVFGTGRVASIAEVTEESLDPLVREIHEVYE